MLQRFSWQNILLLKPPQSDFAPLGSHCLSSDHMDNESEKTDF